MEIIKRIELIEKQARKGGIGKDIGLLLSHTKLLYKYGTDPPAKFSNSSIKHNERAMSQLKIVVNLLSSVLKSYEPIIDIEYRSLMFRSYIYGSKIEELLEHGLDLLEISITGEEEIEEGDVFLGIEEKIKRANKSARDGNAEGLFSNLHTIIELLMKDKLGIALDMDGARLGKVLGICMRNDVFKGKSSILSSLNKNVCDIDNKIKHSGYNPSSKEINDGLLVATQAVRVFRKEIPKLSDDILEEISEILIKNN